jgi:hypothetical protein
VPLVDEGVARADALGVTGVSYGGWQFHSLARLRDRVRLRSGKLVRWRSPPGRPLRIGAAFSVIGWSDPTYALVPDGRFLDFEDGELAQSRTWRRRAGPHRGPDEVASDQRRRRALFTDDLFPPEESLPVYRTFRRVPRANVALQLGDLGHPRGGNKPNTRIYYNDQGARFFDALLKDGGRAPRNRSVTGFTLTCPKGAPGGGPYRARSWRRPDRAPRARSGHRRLRAARAALLPAAGAADRARKHPDHGSLRRVRSGSGTSRADGSG